MLDVEKAIQYVQEYGDNIENARLDSLIWGKFPDEDILHKLEKMQNLDGGFSYWIKEVKISTVSDSVYILRWFDDLGITKGIMLEKAVDFIFNNQKEDGSWDEVNDIIKYNPPPFLVPGNIENRIWLTANCAHWLMKFGYAESAKCKACPVDFLLKYHKPNGGFPGYLRAAWDCLPIFSRYPKNDREPFRLVLNYVESNYSPANWEGSYLTWLLRCLRDAELPATHQLVKECLKDLQDKQRSDGSWNSEDGEEYSASATVEALGVLKDFNLIQNKQPA